MMNFMVKIVGLLNFNKIIFIAISDFGFVEKHIQYALYSKMLEIIVYKSSITFTTLMFVYYKFKYNVTCKELINISVFLFGFTFRNCSRMGPYLMLSAAGP